MSSIRIAPSLLSADFARLGEEIRAVEQAGADVIHFDVMDNHYVPNLTVGPLVCKAIRPHASKPIDVHLMVRPVDRLITDFAHAGAHWISVHPEACDHLDRSLTLIRESNCLAGLALNPATPLSWLDHTLDRLDFVLLMSVNPGFGGQHYLPSVTLKIKQVKQRLDRYTLDTGRHIFIEVDGGINARSIKEAAQAGADTFVAGSAVFNTENYADAIQALRHAATSPSSWRQGEDTIPAKRY